MYTKPKELLSWQARCYEELQVARKDGKDKFLAVAGVGSGKTFFSAYVFADLKRKGEFESVIIVSPSENIKRNWSITFQREFDLKIDHGYSFQYSWPRDCQGISITYQSLTEKSNRLQNLKRYINPKVFLIIDEVHHAGDPKPWGKSIQEVGEKAGFVLLLSGTPTRGDNAPIPFVRYEKIEDAKYELQHDFYYGYAKSIKDKVCCPTIFQRNSSKAETIQSYKMLNSFKEETPSIRRLYNNIISVKEQGNCYVYSTFEKANQKLNEINDKRNKNYAGLIVCKSIPDAEALYQRICNTYGEDFVEIVTSDDQKAGDKIDLFKTSHVPWIISIKMISEGVDIPRIRCIVYASNVTTEIYFQQVMGRGVRNPEHEPNNNDVCYMYIPDYKPLIDNARAIEKKIKHVVQELEEKNNKIATSSRVDTYQTSLLDDLILSATSEDRGSVFSGSIFDVNQDMHATIISKECGVTKDIALKIMDYYKTNVIDITEERPKKLETLTEERAKYKSLIQKMVSKINKKYNIEFSHIHAKLNKILRRPNSNLLTLDESKKKLNLAQQMYEQLSKKNLND